MRYFNIELPETMSVDVRRHVYELLTERQQYGFAGVGNPERVREIQNEIREILAKYDH